MSWQPCVLSKSRIPQEMAFEQPAHFVALGSHVSCEVDTIGHCLCAVLSYERTNCRLESRSAARNFMGKPASRQRIEKLGVSPNDCAWGSATAIAAATRALALAASPARANRSLPATNRIAA
jgi:hypothetical protein